MFACLYSLSAPQTALVKIAEDFTPRFEVVGPLVMLDVSGLSRLFGSPREIGEQLHRGPIRIGVAPTQTAAAFLALGRAGLTVVMPGEEAQVLAALPVTLLGDFDRLRLAPAAARVTSWRGKRADTRATVENGLSQGTNDQKPLRPPHVAEMEDVLPYFHSCLDRASDAARAAHCGGGGWMHPRDSHVARTFGPAFARAGRSGELQRGHAEAAFGGGCGHSARRTQHSALTEIQVLLDTLRRWGVKTFGALAALPVGDVYERLGARGVMWQRLARGEDTGPLVPWVPEVPFEGALDLEWPIEGLEPLSFILGRLLEPLAERLERADRGAAVLHTHLRLVSKETHARTLQLPAPMRDPKTLRTLMLLDLESNPPSAAIDRVRVLIEPTPARVTQWMLFERAQPSPEQVSTLLARLTALMGETHVGSPRLLNTWKPGAFVMDCFAIGDRTNALRDLREAPAPASALRRFRLPVPARVQVVEGRPVRMMVDRRGVTGGAIVQAAGPWRTSGEWWNDGQGQVGQVRQVGKTDKGLSHPTHPPPLAHVHASYGETSPKRPLAAKAGPTIPTNWDRDEWDVAIADGTVYRVFVERDVGQWFIEGVID